MTAPSTIACYAKLVGPSHAVFYLTRPRATLGRKVSYVEGTLYESGEKVPIADFFVGSSLSISRIHCTIAYSVGNGRQLSRYEVSCSSKNGMWVDGTFITQTSSPYPLRSRSLLVLGDACWYFLLPREAKHSDGIIRAPAVSYVSIPLITRSSRLDEEEREREREQRRRKEREERDRLSKHLPHPPHSTSPLPSSHPSHSVIKPTPHPLPVETWSRQERELMKDILLTFPYPRSDLLQRELRREGVRKQPAELTVFIATFIAALMKNAGASIMKQLRTLSPSYALMFSTAPAPPPASTSSPSLSRPAPAAPSALLFSLLSWNLMTKNAKAWSRRLLQLHSLHTAMCTRGSLHLLDDLVSSPRGRLPAVWWSRECDVDLLVGIYKWGYGRFEEMREDRELGFWKIMEGLKARKETQGGGEGGGGGDGAGGVKVEEGVKGEGKVGGGEDEEKPGGEREGEEGEDEDEAEDSDEDDEVDDDDEEDDEGRPRKAKPRPPPPSSSSSSTPATAPPSSSSSSRPASPFSRTLPGPVSKGKTEDGWPISLSLIGRFRQLLKVMKTRDHAAGDSTPLLDAGKKRKTPDAPPSSQRTTIKRARRVLVPGWTDDERSLLTKLLLLVGVPLNLPPQGRWAHIRSELPQSGPVGVLLSRKDVVLDERLDELTKEARALLSPLNERQLLDSLRDKSQAMLAALFHTPLTPTFPASLTPLLSSHLLSHLRYFHQSRTTLALPPTSTPPAPPSTPSPPWWKLLIHDRYLVIVVNKHGWRLGAIDEDLVSPFKMYGGLEGYVKGVGVGVGMEWLVERWKVLVDFWSAEKEREGTAKELVSGGSGKEERKDRRSGGSSSSSSSSQQSQSLKGAERAGKG